MDHVFGYTCGNDISARDWQKGRPGGQWLLGKTFDTFAPLGPTIITKDEIANVHQLEISLELNGNTMQHSNTKNLIFPIDFLISHLSRFCTLQPGDLLFTGTPSGVGAARKPPVYLQPEDQLVVKIDGCNDLENKVVSSS
jgi:2-keto-4-pentenoate hydratase/2-oxohepta-3-ene-1,7-dioic acid hydratase in catechol pathway